MTYLGHCPVIANIMELRAGDITGEKLGGWRFTVEWVSSGQSDHFGITRNPSIRSLVVLRLNGGENSARGLDSGQWHPSVAYEWYKSLSLPLDAASAVNNGFRGLTIASTTLINELGRSHSEIRKGFYAVMPRLRKTRNTMEVEPCDGG